MKIEYAMSLWNYTHYSKVGSLEEVMSDIRGQGYGAEIWSPFVDGTDLLEDANVEKARLQFADMPLSWHARGGELEGLKAQVAATHKLGGTVIVVHRAHFGEDQAQAIAMCRDIVQYAAERGVTVSLENGSREQLRPFFESVEGLGFCLDIGHAVLEGVALRDYVHEFGAALNHLHLQDTLPEVEKHLPAAPGDHYTCGTGGISEGDWHGLCDGLRQIDFKGMGVFEVRPRPPMQAVHLSRQFFVGSCGV